jgi:hypothetical protein
MPDILFQLTAIAHTARMTAPTQAMVIAMSTIQSAIDKAATVNKLLFAGYVVLLLLTAIATILLWASGNRVQDEIRKDADARIATADSRGEEAKRGAAEARAESDKANAGLVKSNEEIARLTAEAEKAKSERAEADKQIAIAKADAARAKEGIANAEAVSAKAGVEVARLRVVVANAETKRAEAEKDLLELREKITWRHLAPAQRATLVKALKASPNKGEIVLNCPFNNAEAFAFAEEFRGVFKEAEWPVVDNAVGLMQLPATATGIILTFGDESPDSAGQYLARAIISGRPSDSLILTPPNPRLGKDRVVLTIGTKP